MKNNKNKMHSNIFNCAYVCSFDLSQIEVSKETRKIKLGLKFSAAFKEHVSFTAKFQVAI